VRRLPALPLGSCRGSGQGLSRTRVVRHAPLGWYGSSWWSPRSHIRLDHAGAARVAAPRLRGAPVTASAQPCDPLRRRAVDVPRFLVAISVAALVPSLPTWSSPGTPSDLGVCWPPVRSSSSASLTTCARCSAPQDRRPGARCERSCDFHGRAHCTSSRSPWPGVIVLTPRRHPCSFTAPGSSPSPTPST